MDFEDGEVETAPECVDLTLRALRALLGWLTEQIDLALERDDVPVSIH